MSIDTDQRLNGWDLQALQDAIATTEANPEAGRLVWRGRVNRDAHFGIDAHAEAIERLGGTIPRRFTLRGDHPPELLGENTGPTAVETLLATRDGQWRPGCTRSTAPTTAPRSGPSAASDGEHRHRSRWAGRRGAWRAEGLAVRRQPTRPLCVLNEVCGPFEEVKHSRALEQLPSLSGGAANSKRRASPPCLCPRLEQEGKAGRVGERQAVEVDHNRPVVEVPQTRAYRLCGRKLQFAFEVHHTLRLLRSDGDDVQRFTMRR